MTTTLRNDTGIELPEVLTTYLSAKLDADLDTIVACFTDDALVHDEGHDHRGRAAIRAWLAELASTYTITYRLLGAERWAGGAALRLEVAGNFPGSPVALHQHFSLAGDRIAALTICL
ncbi:MAG TPA: nuclear transport factor 2 family protein [Pseudonocardia sp.]|jgi:ketosteroid isomerase-like protein|nr:nuclear transport factor 2 family protein [Pseudonocardia sp.]